MKSFYRILTFAVLCTMAASALSSCTDKSGIGDESSDLNTITEEKVYSDKTYTRRVLYDLYGRTREVVNNNQGSFSRLKSMATTVCMLDNATDDGCGEMGSNTPKLMQYTNGAITASTNPVADTHPWTWYYKAIRAANGFIANVDGSVLDDAEKVASKAQARCLRAIYYHELFRWFGSFVISEKREDPFDKSAVRSSEKDCVDWLISEFDALIDDNSGLDDAPSDEDMGIATRAAAYAYKARTLLYAASPLHAAKTGRSWAEAAAAAKDMIDFAEDTGSYGLYYDATDPAKSYAHLFSTRGNTEYIFWYNQANNNVIYHLMPPVNPWNVNKELSTCPTQRFVDSYDMADGEPAFLYDEYGRPTGVAPGSTYDPAHPYAGRDPRLDQTILHDGTVWPLVNGGPATMDISTADKWVSGYFVIKFCDERVDHRNNGSVCMNFPMMRLGEIYLDYAEAINEAQNTTNARKEACKYLNLIRDRAGITGSLQAEDFSQSSMRQRIWRERRVELAWEEHRFFDIRRWQIAKVVMKDTPQGITKDSSGNYHTVTFNQRTYADKMDLSPIPLKDVNSCKGIWQTPGY